jgi:hypothetical protein
MGGQARNYIAAVDATGTGAINATWVPVLTGSGTNVTALAVDGSGILYVGGRFTTVGGTARNNIAGINISDASLATWNPNVTEAVYALAMSSTDPNAVFAGGTFTGINSQTRTRLAALDATTGALTTWNPVISGTTAVVSSLAATATEVYVGGTLFSTVGGLTRNGAFSVTSAGAVSSWNPNANGSVNALAIDGSTIYLGGAFTTVGGTARNRVASVTSTAGALNAWNPSASGIVYALLIDGSTLYVGGAFATISAVTRNGIASYDTSTGTISAWAPGGTVSVYSLNSFGGLIYAGGTFTSIGGQTRSKIAALNTGASTATTWNPSASTDVNAIAAYGSTIYAGGIFTTSGGQSRLGFAALDSSTGLATSLTLTGTNNVAPIIKAFAVRGSNLYMGGTFGISDTKTRSGVLSIDLTTGNFAW